MEINIERGSITVEPGLLYLDWGKCLQIGPIEIVSCREAARREDHASSIGRRVGREEATGERREHSARAASWHVTRSILERFNNIEDRSVEEKAWADFGSKMLTSLCQHPEDFTIAHLEMLADALGVRPSELIEATS